MGFCRVYPDMKLCDMNVIWKLVSLWSITIALGLDSYMYKFTEAL